MNKSIIVAAVSLSIMVVSRVIMGGLALWFGSASPLSALLPVAVALLILIGIIKGHRLAWQWGRMLGLLGAVVLTFTAIMVSLRIPEQPLLLITAVLVALQGRFSRCFVRLERRGRGSISASSAPSAEKATSRAAIFCLLRLFVANVITNGLSYYRWGPLDLLSIRLHSGQVYY